MEVLVAKSAGFCWGVWRAVTRARELAARTPGGIYTDGPLIHSEQMMRQLESEGVHETSDPASVPGATLLIRAHGIPPARREALRALPVTLADATCPDVARIQGTVRRYARGGCAVLIFGDRGHAEVDGLLGFTEGRGHLLTGPADIAALPDLARVCLVAQSTQLPSAFAEVAEAVRRRFPDAVVVDTICAATRSRQQELLAMAPQVDAFVIVGGAHSANTVRLADLARSLKPTLHIATPDQLRAADLRGCRRVGLSAGASTPDFLIQRVRELLEAMPLGAGTDAAAGSAAGERKA